MEIVTQIKPVSCHCLLIEQQWPFFVAGCDDPSFVFWPCVNNNQIITGRKTLCLKFTFGAAIELQRASYLHAANHSVVRRAGRRTWFISTLLWATFTALIIIRFLVQIIQVFTRAKEQPLCIQSETFGHSIWNMGVLYKHISVISDERLCGCVFTFLPTAREPTQFYVLSYF